MPTTVGPLTTVVPGHRFRSAVRTASDANGPRPRIGAPGTVLLVMGNGFGGATRVRIGSTVQSFRVLSPTLIQVLVNARTETGEIEVTTPGGVRRSEDAFGVP